MMLHHDLTPWLQSASLQAYALIPVVIFFFRIKQNLLALAIIYRWDVFSCVFHLLKKTTVLQSFLSLKFTC